MKESWNLKERRRHPRIRVTHMALLTATENGNQKQTIAVGRVLDISSCGVKTEVLAAPRLIRVGADIVVRLAIEDSAVEVAGKVVRSSPAADGKQILGIELDEPIKDLRAGIGTHQM